MNFPPHTMGDIFKLTENPLVKFEDTGKAAILRYDLPASTSYSGLNYIELTDITSDWFKAEYRGTNTYYMKPIITNILTALDRKDDSTMTALTKDYLKSVSPALYTAKPAPVTSLITLTGELLETSNPTATNPSKSSGNPTHNPGPIAVVAELIKDYKMPVMAKTQSGGLVSRVIPIPISKPRIMIVQKCSLSSFHADYGAGRTVDTLSLLPGEKTVITIKSWKKSSVMAKEASSIFDSHSSETEDEFATSVQSESSHKEQQSESFSWHAEAEAEASWGWGSAKVSGGAAGSSNSATEDFVKNVHNASSKHVAKKSSKRDISVTSSFETRSEAGEEQVFQRTLENVNMSRVLNFVIRQLNQEFISILHLHGIRISVVVPEKVGDQSVPRYHDYFIGELDDLLEKYIVSNKRDVLRGIIINELCSILDFRGNKQKLIEAVAMDDVTISSTETIKAGETIDVENYQNLPLNVKQKFYLRVTKHNLYPMDPQDEYTLEKRILSKIDGIVLSLKRYILRTDSVVVDALLGQGQALDQYALDTQKATIESKVLANEVTQAEIAKSKLAQSIVENKDDVQATIFEKVYPKPEKST